MKGLAVIAFGTSHKDTYEKNIRPIYDHLKENFDGQTELAFTSRIIKKILEKRGEFVFNEKEVIAKLQETCDEIYILPLHILRGFEYEKIERIGLGKVAKPLLETKEDIEFFAKNINLPKDKAIIFMGHGTEHQVDWVYGEVEEAFRKLGYDKVFVGTVEGSRSIEDILPRVKEAGITEVTLRPLMLVAGDHAKNDMAGDDEDSWKSILESQGIKVDAQLIGLGEEEFVRDMYYANLKEIMN